MAAALGAALLLLLPASAAADQVELRGGAPAVEGTVAAAGPAGLVVRTAAGEQRVPWSEVRAVAGAAPADAAQWLAAGEALWRGRMRSQRGDWSGALEPLERAAAAWRGAEPSADGAGAALLLAQAYANAGRWADGLPVAFEAMRVLRAGASVPAWAQGSHALVDAPRVLPAAFPPMALAGPDAARAAAALRALGAGDDAWQAAVAAVAALLEGAPAPSRAGLGRQAEAERQGQALLDAIRNALSDDATMRAAGRKSLASLRRGLPAWADAWAQFATGASLAAEPDITTSERGVVELLKVDAEDAATQPCLAAAARQRAASTLEALGDAPGAQRVRRAGQLSAAPASGGDVADPVAARLEALGLQDILTTHLEQQLEAALTDEERAALVGRLALLLAARLENEPDAARRDAIMARSLRIVDKFDNGSEPLRLALLRSQHRAAQRVAEDRRAGRADDARTEAALAQFRQLGKSLQALVVRTLRARDQTERQISTASGLQAELLAERSAQQEQVARSADFFTAWALYYQAWLGRELGQEGWRDRASEALAMFSKLIEPGKAAVDPSEVSLDLRRNEGFASAVLGSALTASLTQSAATADAWMALLDAPSTHESVRTKLPAWRMASYLDRGDFRRALQLLTQEGDGPQGVPMALIAAARAARAPQADGAADVLTEAVARIAGAGRLSDLAAMSGVAEGAGTGAGAQLFEGVRAASRAQRLQQGGDAAGAKQAWDEAARALQAALDAGPPPAIAAGASALQGWALRGAGRPAEAAQAFIASAAGATGDRAGDALWSAVLCLDEASRTDSSNAGGAPAGGAPAAPNTAQQTPQDVIQTLLKRLIEDLPGTSAATRAHAWRVTHMPTPAQADIEALLSAEVPTELAPAARKAALEGLYRRFRTLAGADRAAAARRALGLGDAEPPGAGDDGTAELRRRVEMAVGVDDATRAAESLAALEARVEQRPALAQQLAQELAARRVQVAALTGKVAQAMDAARATDPATPWGRVAWRAARDALLRDQTSSMTDRAQAARAVVVGIAPSSPPPADVVAWVVAETALLRSPTPAVDPAGAAAALERALEERPRDLDLLLSDAAFRWARGDRSSAAERLGTLVGRLPMGTDAWYAAKTLQIRVVADGEPARARAILEQVKQLSGGLGQGAAARGLAELDQTLPMAAGATP